LSVSPLQDIIVIIKASMPPSWLQ